MHSVSLSLSSSPSSSIARADDKPVKFTVLLDWFLNPDHAPLFTAQYIGAFKQQGLDVTLIAPSDPSLPPTEIAAGKGDVAISYQPQLYQFAQAGLPLVRIGTSVDMPLNTLTTIKSDGITTMADFKGKKIGYSVAGEEDILVGVMLKNAGVDPKDVTLINVNFNTVSAIMSHQVDGSIGDFRTGEDIELADKGQDPVPFFTEDNGIPMYDELVYIANKKDASDPKMARFLKAVQAGHDLFDRPPGRNVGRLHQGASGSEYGGQQKELVRAYPDLCKKSVPARHLSLRDLWRVRSEKRDHQIQPADRRLCRPVERGGRQLA